MFKNNTNNCCQIIFSQGTLIVKNLNPSLATQLKLSGDLVFDSRIDALRGRASSYKQIKNQIQKMQSVSDEVLNIELSPLKWLDVSMRTYQIDSYNSWLAASSRGIICLPTGAGKTRVAILAMANCKESALCLVPTRVLLEQWVKSISEVYSGKIGIIGDGEHHIEAITVSTFESAYRYMPRLGNRFHLLIVDEIHHFGLGTKDEAISMCAAPKKLGLTATPPQNKAQMDHLEKLVGPIVHTVSTNQLIGTYLAPFDIQKILVNLSAQEKGLYDLEHDTFKTAYKDFKKVNPVGNWSDFTYEAFQSQEGRRGIAAFYRSRRITSYCLNKKLVLEKLLKIHFQQKILIFTADTLTALKISKDFLVPAIISEISKSERKSILSDFSKGLLSVIVACKVLNEGFDVPEAEIAIIIGGSSDSREHTQRIGRILRPFPEKTAKIYELVARKTHEELHSIKRGR